MFTKLFPMLFAFDKTFLIFRTNSPAHLDTRSTPFLCLICRFLSQSSAKLSSIKNEK